MRELNADEVLTRWVPVAIPVEDEMQEREEPVFATRYTALPAVMVH